MLTAVLQQIFGSWEETSHTYSEDQKRLFISNWCWPSRVTSKGWAPDSGFAALIYTQAIGQGRTFMQMRCFFKGSQSRMRKSNVPSILNQVHNLNSLLWAPSLAVGWCNKQAELQKQKCQTEHYMEDLLNFPCHSCFGEGVSIARNWATVHFFDHIAGLGTIMMPVGCHLAC